MSIINVILKSKWTWICVVILVVVFSVYGFSRYQAAKYEREAAALTASNEKLKAEAADQEKQFAGRLSSMSKQAFEINKKLAALKKDNDNLKNQNAALAKKSADLEVKYAELHKKLVEIKVPVSLADRAALLRKLGY